MVWIDVLKVVLPFAPPIIEALLKNKSNNKDVKRIIEALELAEKYRDDSRLLMENQSKLLEVMMLILNRMPVGGYPQVAGGYPQVVGGYPQVAGGYPQVAGGYPQMAGGYLQVAGGYPQVAGEELQQFITGRRQNKIRIEIDLPQNPKELEQLLEMFWKTMGNHVAAYKDHERQQLSLRHSHQEGTQVQCRFICGICCQKYNVEKRLPKVLKCGHTFCQQCIRNTRKQSLECPACQKISPEPFKDLPANYEILKLMPQDEAVESHKMYPRGASAFSDSSDEDDGLKKRYSARERIRDEDDGLKKRYSARDRIRDEKDDFGPSREIPIGANGVTRSPDAVQVPKTGKKLKEQQMWEKEEDDSQLYSLTNQLRIMTTEEEEELDYAITKARVIQVPNVAYLYEETLAKPVAILDCKSSSR